MPPEPKVAKVAKAPKIANEPKPPKAPKASAKSAKVPTLTEVMAKLLAKELLPDLTKRARQPSLERALQQAWQKEKDAQRTAATFSEWTEHTVEQVGAAWILSCLFVRVLEDRGMLARPRIAGEAGGHAALDSQHQFFEIAPSLTERDYLLTVFHELSSFPGAADVLGPAHNPAWRLSPSNDAVRSLLAVLRETDDAGALRYRFDRAAQPTTRFLGDLYQDLSEGVCKRYALLQTPVFVERFILDGTLEPAISEFGLAEVRVIDPTCGSGHFLLGAFERLCDHWQRTAPGMPEREVANLALAQVYGVDLNPYAVAIARFRLTLAYLDRAGIDRLSQAPRIETNLVVADSLLHRAGQGKFSDVAADDLWLSSKRFELDEPERASAILGQGYHAVVGNPPYITCKDAALRELYREAYTSAAGKYALAAPFTERFFRLGVDRGFIGLINANSFMKREFGKALIEQVLPEFDLTKVVDTSGAYIPGHGTPTVILFGRKQKPLSERVPAVMGKRGEPSTPQDPERGLVWASIAAHHGEVGFENDYVSVADVERSTLGKHPWSLGGGGAAELKELLEAHCDQRLGMLATAIGIASVTGEDEVYRLPLEAARRARLEHVRPIIVGDEVRDWSLEPSEVVVFPYDSTLELLPLAAVPQIERWLWSYYSVISKRKRFGVPMLERGYTWYELQELYSEKLRTPLTITYAEVATHNHFVLDRGGKVFNRTAPVIKLPATATEDDHLALVACLNSSAACFYLRQVAHNKGAQGVNEGHKSEAWEQFIQRNGAAVATLPIPNDVAQLAPLARRLADIAVARAGIVDRCIDALIEDPTCSLDAGQAEEDALLAQACGLQEAIDWVVYRIIGIADQNHGDPSRLATMESPEPCPPGQRAFERRLVGTQSRWVQSNKYLVDVSTQPSLVTEARLAATDGVPSLELIEQPEYKYRWTRQNIEMRTIGALWDHVQRQVESLLEEPRPRSLRQLSLELGSTCAGLLAKLDDATSMRSRTFDEDAIPFLARLRFTEGGVAKYMQWERCWDAQRRGEVIAEPPPRFDSKDYSKPRFWQLRGKLDVPKERFISYPGLERDEDPSPLIGWAGWDHLQRAQALAHLFQERKEQDGWDARRLTPILAGMLELLPWLKQWHNEPNAELGGERMGDAYDAFVKEKARELGLTLDDLRAWRPEKTAGRGAAAKAAKAKSAAAAGPDDDELS